MVQKTLWRKHESEQMNDLIVRQMVSGENATVARLLLARGAVVPRHSHDSEQFTLVLSGTLRFVFDDQEVEVNEGEVLFIPANVPHSAVALTDTVDLDFFCTAAGRLDPQGRRIPARKERLVLKERNVDDGAKPAGLFGARRCSHGARRWAAAVLLAATFAGAWAARADQPFAPSPEYALQNARIELRFDLDQHRVIGKVTHTLAAVRDGMSQLDFDSAELTIASVRVNGKDAHFSTDASKLHVDLERPSKAGEKYEVAISYEGKPKKGLYFVFPDASNPAQPKEIWTQGEAEDTHYYIPIYDYPNDRTTTEMLVTVPRDWVTVSNGKLVSVVDAPNSMKTWTWRQPEPIATYLISLVAGEFEESKQTWRNIPVDYIVPRGRADRVEPTFVHTRDMLTFFSERFGVPYAWEKYDQTMVDQFVEGGMENVSATTLTARGLLHPQLARESMEEAPTG